MCVCKREREKERDRERGREREIQGWEKNQILKPGMKVEMLLPPEFTKAKRIIGEYDERERLYTNKLDKLNKMEKFLETHKLQKPTQEEMEYLKRIISNKQNQSIIKKTFNKENPGPDDFTDEVYENFEEEIIPI